MYSVTNWLSLGSIRPCESGDVFYLSRDHDIEVSRDFVGGVLSAEVTNWLNLGSIGLTKVKI